MTRFLTKVVAVALLLTSAVAVSPAANADTNSDCVWDGVSYDCTTQVTQPGGPGSTTQGPKPGELTGATKECTLDGEAVPCSTKYGWFVNDGNCTGYVQLSDAQPAPPPGEVAGGGAYYTCTLACQVLHQDQVICDRALFAVDYWSRTPPPGVDRYTPAQAAAALARSFRLVPIEIGMAPEKKTHADDPAGTAAYRRTWVGIPVWLWVAHPTPLNYGPYEQTATLGGVTVTARASVTEVDWTSSDGQQVTCGPGTVFDPVYWANRPAEPSPTCGLRFARTSTDQPDSVWAVTGTSHWAVTWTGGGQNGTMQLDNLTATTPVIVRELQSVNVPVTAALIGGH
jgi:hypothetical protein